MPRDIINAALLEARRGIAADLTEFRTGTPALPLTPELADELELYIDLIDTLIAERHIRPAVRA